MTSNFNPAVFGPITTAISNVEISRYVSLAGYSVLLYDHVLMLPHEMTSIWTAKWSIVKILFLLYRYTVPVALTIAMVAVLGLTPTLNVSLYASYIPRALNTAHVFVSCRKVAVFFGYYQLVSLAVVDVIVALRIHALYGRRQSVFVVIAVLWVAGYASQLVLLSVFVAQLYPTINFSTIPQFELCFAVPPPGMWLIWLPGTIYDSIICFLTGYKTWTHYTIDNFSLRQALFNDGFPYVLATFVVRLMTLLLWRFGTPSTMLLGLDFAYSVVTIVGSRMLLKLPGVKQPQEWALQTQQEQTQIAELMRSESPWDGSDNRSTHTTSSTTSNLWLVDQGGLSFLEQIYQLTRKEVGDVRPTFIGMEKFDVR